MPDQLQENAEQILAPPARPAGVPAAAPSVGLAHGAVAPQAGFAGALGQASTAQRAKVVQNLQRGVGNQGVNRWLAQPSPVAPKLMRQDAGTALLDPPGAGPGGGVPDAGSLRDLVPPGTNVDDHALDAGVPPDGGAPPPAPPPPPGGGAAGGDAGPTEEEVPDAGHPGGGAGDAGAPPAAPPPAGADAGAPPAAGADSGAPPPPQTGVDGGTAPPVPEAGVDGGTPPPAPPQAGMDGGTAPPAPAPPQAGTDGGTPPPAPGAPPPAAPAPPQGGTDGGTPPAPTTAPPQGATGGGPPAAPPAAPGGTSATAPPGPTATGPAGPTTAPPGPDGQIGGQSTLPPDACVSPDAPGSADLISFELAEHQAWGAASADVGGAASETRADFIADTVGGGMNTGLVTGAATGLVVGFGGAAAGRIAARRIPIPVVGAIIGGAIGAWGLYNTIVNEPDKFTGAVGKIGEGASGYETAANTIEGIMAILDLAANVIDVVAGVTGIIAAIAWAGVIPSFGASSPIAATCTTIAIKAALISTVLGMVKAALGPLALLFRSLHAFTTQADPREVQAQAGGLSDAAKGMGGFMGAMAGAAVGSHVGEAVGGRIANRMGPPDPPRVPAGAGNTPPVVEGRPTGLVDAEGRPIMAPGESPILDANGRPFNAEPAPAGPILDANGRPMTPEGPSSILDPTGTPYGPGNRPSAPDVPAPSPIIDPGTGRPVGSTPPAPLVNPTTGLPVDTLPAPPAGPLITGPDGRVPGAPPPSSGPLILDPSAPRPSSGGGGLLDASGRPATPPPVAPGGPSPIIDPGTGRPVGGDVTPSVPAPPPPAPRIETPPPTGTPSPIVDADGRPYTTPGPSPILDADGRPYNAPAPSASGTPSPIVDASGRPYTTPGPSPILDANGRPYNTPAPGPGPSSPIVDASGRPYETSPIIDPNTGRPVGSGPATPATPTSPILDANGRPMETSPIIDPNTGRPVGTPAPEGGGVLLDQFGRPIGPDYRPYGPPRPDYSHLPYDPTDPSSVQGAPGWIDPPDNALDAQQVGELTTGTYDRNFGAPQPPAAGFTYDNQPFADATGGYSGLWQTDAQAADVRTERVNPQYPEPPGTLADLASLADHETRLRAFATEARADAAQENSSQETLECRDRDLQRLAEFNMELQSARSAHEARVAEARAANQGRQQHEQQVGQRANDAGHQLSGARTLRPLLTGYMYAARGFGSVLGIFSDSAEAKCDESANEAENFITQLDMITERVAREQAAAPARAADAQAEGQAVAQASQQGAAADAEAARTARVNAAMQAAIAQEAAATGSNYERSIADAERAETQADQMKADHDALQAELAAWAQRHREARATAVNETVVQMKSSGYQVTSRPEQ